MSISTGQSNGFSGLNFAIFSENSEIHRFIGDFENFPTKNLPDLERKTLRDDWCVAFVGIILTKNDSCVIVNSLIHIMDYKANKDSLKPKPALHKVKKEIAENMLLDGKTCEETAKTLSVRKSTVVSIRQELEGEGKLELNAWKKSVAGLLGEFVEKGATRLSQNADNIPLGQLPMAIAIAIDKVRDLADAPTIRVETRLKITQDELNNAFLVDTERESGTIDIPTSQNEHPSSTNGTDNPTSSGS